MKSKEHPYALGASAVELRLRHHMQARGSVFFGAVARGPANALLGFC